MSDLFRCDDKDTLMAFIYDEIDPIIRRRVEEHLRTCEACAAEVAALSDVRVDLAAWTPPQLELDFAITRKQESRPVASTTWWSGVPAWAQAAAAVLVVAAGLAIANVHVKSGPDGVVVTTGWMTPASAQASFASVADANADWKPAMTALATQLRSEMHNAQAAGQPVAVQAASRPSNDVMRAVQSMIEASEARQRQELALRLTQFNRDVNVQRSADLVKIDQMFGQLDGRTGAMDARQRQLMNYIQRVSNPQQ